MKTKVTILTLSALLFALCVFAHAQQPTKVPRVGYISGEGDPNNPGPRTAAFRQGLRELGYVEGKNIQVDYRYILGQSERIAGLVAELIQLKPDVLVTASLASTRAAKQQTKTIAIVFRIPDDPVLLGLVESLARPGGNITGLASLGRELSGKRLELLLEAIPTIKRVGLLFSPTGVLTAAALSRRNIEDYEIPARALKIAVHSVVFRNTNQEIENAVHELTKAGVKALVVINTTPLYPFRTKIADLAIKNRRPLLAEEGTWAEAGALMSYATNEQESYRRVAVHVDKILKGTKPADLPVEQPTKFEFVINLKTAKALNLTIPQSVLFRADRVIR
jgi:putative tryptophan/tyrosine transport system substrate-binding protein